MTFHLSLMNEWVTGWLTWTSNMSTIINFLIFSYIPLIRSIIKHIYSDKNINRVIYNIKIDGLLFLIILVGIFLSFHFSTSKNTLCCSRFSLFHAFTQRNFNNHSNEENYFMYSILHSILLWLWLLIQYNRKLLAFWLFFLSLIVCMSLIYFPFAFINVILPEKLIVLSFSLPTLFIFFKKRLEDISKILKKSVEIKVFTLGINPKISQHFLTWYLKNQTDTDIIWWIGQEFLRRPDILCEEDLKQFLAQKDFFEC